MRRISWSVTVRICGGKRVEARECGASRPFASCVLVGRVVVEMNALRWELWTRWF